MKRPLFALILMLVLACAPLTAARATILFSGGEDRDFTCVGNNWGGATCLVSTSATYSHSGYAREALRVDYNGSSNDPPTAYALSPTFTAVSTLWIHATIYIPGTVFGNANNQILSVFSPDGVRRILLRSIDTTTTNIKISTRNAAGTFTDLASMSSGCFTGNAFHNLDLYINYSTSGEVTLYCDGALAADYTGDVTTNSTTQLDQFWFSGPNGNNTPWFSELIAATTDTRAMRLVTLAPVANGATDTWDTGGVTNVNETTDSTATFNASGTAGQIQLYTIGSLPAGSWNVLDVFENMYSLVETTGPQHVDAMVRVGGTNYASSDLSPPVASWGMLYTHWPTNPNTSAAWTTGDLGSGLNFGLQSAN